MKTIIEQLRKRHETTLDFYNTEKLTEKEMNI